MLFDADVEIDLGILRVLAALVVDFEICFVGARPTQLRLIFQAPNLSPRVWNNLLHLTLSAG